MEFTTLNPFVPRATVIRYPNAVFEARIHLSSPAAHVDVVPHENNLIVTGSLVPRVRIDSEGKPSAVVFTDQACGVFGRDIPLNLTRGTEVVVVSAHQDCDDYVIRYTIRNSITPRVNCGGIANAAAGVEGTGECRCPPGMKGSCGGATAATVGAGPGTFVPAAFTRPTHASAVPPALLGRVPGAYPGPCGYGYGGGYAGYPGYHSYGSRFAHHGYPQGSLIFQSNGGVTAE